MKASILVTLFVLTASAAAVKVRPVEMNDFFKGVAKGILESVAVDHNKITPSVGDDTIEIASTLADVIEEDCQSVCPPAVGGDLGVHVIQCIQCITEELGAVLFPEFLEAVLAIRSPELLKEQDEEEQHTYDEDKEKKEEGLKSIEAPETLDSLGLDEIMAESNSDHLIEELTDAFEMQGVSLFKALLGDCRDDCATVTVPQSDPVPCLRCMSSHAAKENAQLLFVNSALAIFNY